MLGFSLLLVFISLLLLGQQYVRHAVFSVGPFMFDIKQYLARIIALIAYLAYKRRKQIPDLQ